jgi:PKD repeat protein
MKRKTSLISAFILLSFYVVAQSSYIPFQQNENTFIDKMPIRTVDENATKSISIEYQFPGMFSQEDFEKGVAFQKLFIEGFTHLKEVGKPALPAHTDLIAIPQDADEISIKIVSFEKMEFDNYYVYPALQPATDRYGDPEPAFEIDEECYSTNAYYPQETVKNLEIHRVRGTKIAFIQLCPIQFNPVTKKLIVYTNIKYRIDFNAQSNMVKPESGLSFLQTMPNFILNDQQIKKEIKQIEKNSQLAEEQRAESFDYIIITHSKYKQAADSLALWKMQLGYTVEVVSKDNWTADEVRYAIHSRYENWDPKPGYFVIIGDNEDVPGDKLISPTNADFHSDLYYACMDGSGDYVPDIAHGRISVSYAGQANLVVRKIINYERNPLVDSNFYKTGLNCAQFQDDDKDGYADRRFSLTSENVKDYMENNTDKSVKRVYAANNDVTPRYWNDNSYANGEALDSSLLKPGFAWDGDKSDIANHINEGAFYVLHRDHGYSGGSGWHMPQLMTNDVKSLLNNGRKLPVVFSINCHTGEFQLSECFAEAFLRKTNGGAVGIMAAAYLSYSGYNDALSLGFFDAIWSNPGLIPDFTGSGGISNPTLTEHQDIYTMGDVLNQALLRMVETWGTNKYTFELFHYFGDPAMRIFTANPQPIPALTHADSIICNTTGFTLSNANITDALVTLVVDGELITSDTLKGSSLTLNFDPIVGEHAFLTVSKHNHIPYIVQLPIVGGCPKARFDIGAQKQCVDNSITITDQSSGDITDYLWRFGEGASMDSATTAGPHQVSWSTPGVKIISLKTSGPAGSNEWSYEIEINENCEYYTPSSGTVNITNCNGVLYDNGGKGLYSNNTNGVVTISPTGASSVTLQFTRFDFEEGYDSLMIFDGPSVYSPLIGSYSGTDLPEGGQITSTSSSITLFQRTDPGLQKAGFEAYFYCNYSDEKPMANFYARETSSCNGVIAFTDMSRNIPENWRWDFGDGNTSLDQHPVHTYTTEGNYSVKLVAGNANGEDSFSRENYVVVDFPDNPSVKNASNCGPGRVSLWADGNGLVKWYDSLEAGNLLGRGNNFETPSLTSSTTYYAQIDQKSYQAGPKDNSMGAGGIFSYTNEHGLIITAYKAVKLHSVYVYASGTADRTIELKDANDFVLATKTINIPDGESRIDLDFDIPIGSGMKLVTANGCDLYRNRNGADFPYEIPGVLSITGSTASSGSYYYFFYDWDISEYDECKSERIPVIAYISTKSPDADFDIQDSGLYYSFTNTSTEAVDFSWDFGDGEKDSINYSPSHKYTDAGDFTVKLLVLNDCGSDISSKSITVVNAMEESRINSELSIYPNPNNGNFVIEIKNNAFERAQILDMKGKLVWEQTLDKSLQRYSIQSDIKSQGMYILRLVGKTETVQHMLLIE